MTGARAAIAALGRSLSRRGLAHGSTGNISVREGDDIVVTPTGTNLATLDPQQLSTIAMNGTHRCGPAPSKEAFLHAAIYRARPDARAVVHTHSTFSTAVSCLDDVDDANVLPALTAYFVMRVGTLMRLPYVRPGDPALGPLAEKAAATHAALLLANHGPIVAAPTLQAAADALEEIEETSKLFLLLRHERTRLVPPAQTQTLRTAHDLREP